MKLLEPASILLALILAYTWSQLPDLQGFSAQLAAGIFLFYFVSKQLSRSRWRSYLPRPETWETALLLAAVAIVVAGTGGITSPFIGLFYLLLFISALTLHSTSNLVEITGLLVFLWAVSPQPFTNDHWIRLLEIPLVLPLALLARFELEAAQKAREQSQQDQTALATQERQMLLFLTTVLRPKLVQFRQMLLMSDQNRPVVAQQLAQIEAEVTELAKSIDEVTNEPPQA